MIDRTVESMQFHIPHSLPAFYPSTFLGRSSSFDASLCSCLQPILNLLSCDKREAEH